jgi:hypothetical protein
MIANTNTAQIHVEKCFYRGADFYKAYVVGNESLFSMGRTPEEATMLLNDLLAYS